MTDAMLTTFCSTQLATIGPARRISRFASADAAALPCGGDGSNGSWTAAPGLWSIDRFDPRPAPLARVRRGAVPRRPPDRPDKKDRVLWGGPEDREPTVSLSYPNHKNVLFR